MDPDKQRLHSETIDLCERLYLAYVADATPSRSIPLMTDIFRTWTASADRTELFRVANSPTDEHVTRRIRTVSMLSSYVFRLPEIINNHWAVPCTRVFDWFVSTQLRFHVRNEANHQCERWSDGTVCAFLTPFVRGSHSPDRQRTLEMEVQAFEQGEFDAAWMFPEDWKRIQHSAPENLRLETSVAGLSLIRRHK